MSGGINFLGQTFFCGVGQPSVYTVSGEIAIGCDDERIYGEDDELASSVTRY
jgi:hypothetical protein